MLPSELLRYIYGCKVVVTAPGLRGGGSAAAKSQRTATAQQQVSLTTVSSTKKPPFSVRVPMQPLLSLLMDEPEQLGGILGV